MTTSTPDFTDVLAQIVEFALGRVRVAMPGTIVSYDATKQKATVQPVVRETYLDAESGELEQERVEPIANVPVAFPSAGNFSITWPLAKGDSVMLIVADRSIAEWKQTGQSDNEPQDPKRRFDWTDAIAVPAMRSFADPIPAAGRSASAMVIRADDLRLGSSTATSAVSLATLTDAQLSALEAVFTAWVPVPGDGGAALKTALSTLVGTGWPSSTAASKVKAE